MSTGSDYGFHDPDSAGVCHRIGCWCYTYAPHPDLRDARIAHLEAEVARLEALVVEAVAALAKLEPAR